MALLEALSDAAAEITADLPGGAVEVRMKGREPQLVVSAAVQPADAEAPGATPDADEPDDEGALARITVRIPESLKARAEELASRRGQSLNGWIVYALRLATRDRAIDVDIDLSAVPFGPGGAGFGPRRSRRVQGWVR
ncbi:MAG: type II toxin-antitoxin system HicB family antitoxin, partial [Actinomycetota bacterium]|nr:type II toxin-antitoxin system HicB family antitoxin [Actinomycetota bacterium]